jgi:hypothetical protein
MEYLQQVVELVLEATRADIRASLEASGAHLPSPVMAAIADRLARARLRRNPPPGVPAAAFETPATDDRLP